jgi:poly(3-hydroxybutyrate) depolymerase
MKTSKSLIIGLLALLVSATIPNNDSQEEQAAEVEAPKLERASLEVDPIRGPVKSKGCSVEFKFAAAPGGESKRLKIGEDRFIRITLPQNYVHGTPAPLILAFHDKNMTAKDMEDKTLLSSPSYNKDAIVVYPEAKLEVSCLSHHSFECTDNVKKDRWLSDAKPPPEANDIEFVGEIIDKLTARLCIDEDRVYAAGLGNGAGMMHLMACSRLSSRIAAFSLVNGNVLAGSNRYAKNKVHDPTRAMWDECITYRSIVRLQAIHSENNTIFDYWAETKDGVKPRRAVVEHLVEWANRNNCGEGLAHPVPWRNKDDPIHKTLLQQGYIFEGFIEEGAVMKATYHCWPGDYGKFQQQDTELNEDGSMKDGPIVPKVDDPRTEEEKMTDLLHRLNRNMIQEHLYIRNTGHGWHRVEKVRDANDAKRKEEKGALGFTQPPTTWKDIPNPPDYDPDTSFNKKVLSTFAYGYHEPQELVDRPPRFDTTAKVLQFFRTYRLSDPSPKASRDADGLTEPEDYTVQMFAKQLGDALDDKVKELEDNEGEPLPVDKDYQVPMVDMGSTYEAAPGKVVREEKDEL